MTSTSRVAESTWSSPTCASRELRARGPARVAAGLTEQPVERRRVGRDRHDRTEEPSGSSVASVAKPPIISRHACALAGSGR